MNGCAGNCRSTKIRDERRRQIVKNAGRCENCDQTENLELDHMIPRSRGGCHCEDNLWVLCRACNRHKWTLTAYEFVESGLAGWLRKRQYAIWNREIQDAIATSDWRYM